MLPDFRRAWTRDVETTVTPLQEKIAELGGELAALKGGYRRLLVADLDRRNERELQALDARLPFDRIRDHVIAALERTPVDTAPTSHLVVENLFPDDFYDLLIRTMPPRELFSDRDPVKQDFEIDALETAPALTARVWRFFDQQIVAEVLAPALLARFRPAVVRHYAATGGGAFAERAAAIPHRSFAGRIQLRRPGYELKPHLDPKRVVITGLIYFARPGDADAFGTQLFEVDRPFVQAGMKTFFPEQHGMRCTLAKTVPFRPNTMLAFVNSGAAHGASLPPGAPLQERHAYQFYLKPIDGELKTLLRDLPEAARAPWSEFLA